MITTGSAELDIIIPMMAAPAIFFLILMTKSGQRLFRWMVGE